MVSTGSHIPLAIPIRTSHTPTQQGASPCTTYGVGTMVDRVTLLIAVTTLKPDMPESHAHDRTVK